MSMEPSIQDKLIARVENELKKPTVTPSKPRPLGIVNVPQDTADRPRPSDYAPPDQRPDNVTRALGPLPPYVTHAPGASRQAQIAGHALMAEFDKAASEVERTGAELTDKVNAAVQDTIETARFLRERGAELFRQTQTAFRLVDEAVATNLKMREQIMSAEHVEPPASEEEHQD